MNFMKTAVYKILISLFTLCLTGVIILGMIITFVVGFITGLVRELITPRT